MYEHVGRLPLKRWRVSLIRRFAVVLFLQFEVEAFDEMGAIAVTQQEFEAQYGPVPNTAHWEVQKV